MSDFTAASTKDSKVTLDERTIDAEYKIWKKNTPYLYDFVMTHALEWPSLTCQWLPTVKHHNKSSGGSIVEHSMIVGTHTSQGDQNYLMVASINLPKKDSDEDRPVLNSETESLGEGGKGNAKSVASKKAPAAQYDEERSELGGYGTGDSSIGKIHIRMKIKHDGEVHRARYMPQNHFIVASRGPQAPLYIWDFSKHPSFPEAGSQKSQAQGMCLGHDGEGYGLCWSPHKAGLLISSSEDKTVRLWDVNAAMDQSSSSSSTVIHPLSTFTGHTDVVEDVDWHHRDENLIGSVGDDKSFRIWDIRATFGQGPVHTNKVSHDLDVNSISFNPVNEFLFATGSADTTIALWDLRNPEKYVCFHLFVSLLILTIEQFISLLHILFMHRRVQTLKGHTDQVFNLSWAPFNESILASCSADRRVAIWDLSRIGMEQTPEDAEDGPPELLFIHGGHCSKVSDFSWNANDQWTMVSVADDNVLQVWSMAEEIYTPDDDDEDDDGDENDEEKGGALDEDDLE